LYEFVFNETEINDLLGKINIEATYQSMKNVPSDMLTLNIAKIQKNIKISIRTNEGNHTIPHFHVETTDYSGSYTIDPIRRLAGNMPSWLEKIFIPWVAKHKSSIKQKWDELRPTG
jgi:Domain of unknown function (DUF4160)